MCLCLYSQTQHHASSMGDKVSEVRTGHRSTCIVYRECCLVEPATACGPHHNRVARAIHIAPQFCENECDVAHVARSFVSSLSNALTQFAHDVKESMQHGLHKVGEVLHMTGESAKSESAKMETKK